MKESRKGALKLVTLAMLAVLLVVAGCSGSNNNAGNGNGGASSPTPAGNTGSAGNNAGAEEPAPQLQPYEVKIVYYADPQKDDDLVEKELSRYLQEKINATVDLVPIAPDEYKQKSELMLQTKEKMDLIFTTSWLDFYGNITKKAYLELDDLLAEHGKELTAALNPLFLEGIRYQGKLYAVPTNKEITQAKAFTYRKDIVEKYNIDYENIKHMADLEPYLKLIQENEPNLIPNYVFGSNGNDVNMYESESTYRSIGPAPSANPTFFVDIASNDMTVKTILDPEIMAIYTEQYDMFRDWYEKKYTNQDALTATTNGINMMKEGKVWYNRGQTKPGQMDELKVTIPQYEFLSRPVEEPLVTTDKVAGAQLAIPTTSEDPARAMMVLNLMHTDPYVVNLLVHGIEDRHYKKVGDNRIELIADSGYNPGVHWILGNQMLNYLKPGQSDDLYKDMEAFNNSAKQFQLLGFLFDNTSVMNEIGQMNAIYGEYKGLSSGAYKDVQSLIKERNDKLKAAGLEKVRDELQKQIDDFLAGKQ